MRIWIDMTAPAHVLVFRPLIALLRQRGAVVEITARDYGQTVQLLELHDVPATVFGAHAGRSRARKLTSMLARMRQLRRWARHRRFDVALTHGSHEMAMTARSLGVPSATTFDYEFAKLQHHLGCRAAQVVVVPDAIPLERLRAYGVTQRKARQYPGLKEEYYLADFAPDPSVPVRLGVDEQRVVVTVRTPPDVALYHRHENALFPALLDRLGRDEAVHAVVLPRTDEQRDQVRSLDLPSLIVPDAAIDAQSMIAASDLVVSAGGTINREAVALGVPVFTTFGGRLGAVDEQLLRERRLHRLEQPSSLELVKRDRTAAPPTRDPQQMLDLLLQAVR